LNFCRHQAQNQIELPGVLPALPCHLCRVKRIGVAFDWFHSMPTALICVR
jgi:hypothetical protein